VHIQYAYDTRAVLCINHTLTHERGLRAVIRVRNLDGGVAYERRLRDIDLPENSARQLAVLPALDGLSRAYFVEIELSSSGGRSISRNVYWLSTQTDEPDWEHSTWYLTPVSRHADLTPLQSLPAATATVRATMRHEGAEDIAAVTLSVPSSSQVVALFQHVSLWPGETLTLTARLTAPVVQAPVVEVSGWNVPTQSVPLAIEGPAAPREMVH